MRTRYTFLADGEPVTLSTRAIVRTMLPGSTTPCPACGPSSKSPSDSRGRAAGPQKHHVKDSTVPVTSAI
jgi:hypothetical protein